MQCPVCEDDGISFWRLWLFNLRQRVRCDGCGTTFLVETPDRVAGGTFAFLLLSGGAFFVPGGRGLGLALLLFGIVANFVLTHHFVELLDEYDIADDNNKNDNNKDDDDN